jgi:16S rRNA (adenine1518-N6/adenine1519-N6)-dimethyltransferase
MIQAVSLKAGDSVLEIGPGQGAITFLIEKHAKNVVAVEIDRGFYARLKQRYEGSKHVDVVCADILKFNLKAYLKKKKIKRVKVVANLPYYITTPIIEYLFKNISVIDDIFITIQKEVAERMIALPGGKTYGSFTCFVNYFCLPKILFKIKKDSFWPVPKVDSSFVRLKPYSSDDRPFHVHSQELFFKIIRSSFGQRRKQIFNPLSKVLSKEDLRTIFNANFLSQRAENLSGEDFARASNLIFDFLKKR